MVHEVAQHFQLTPQVKEFFLARQPILNRSEHLVGYKLLFRRAAPGQSNSADDWQGAVSIIAHISELGIANVIGPGRGFFTVNFNVLMHDLVKFLPRGKVVFEIPQTIKITPELVQRVTEMANAGYTFALCDVITFS